MASDDVFPERRKKMSALEMAILQRAFALTAKGESKDIGNHYVVDVAMGWPTGLHYRLYMAYASAQQRHWPQCLDTPWWLRDRPDCDTSSWDESGTGLWSMLPTRLYRQVGRQGTSPQQALINVVSDALDTCDLLADLFMKCTAEEWPDIPSLNFFIESSHWLVASQQFASEQDASRWLALADATFNNPAFEEMLKDIDKQHGFVRGEGVVDDEPWESDEQQYFHEGLYHKPLKVRFSGLLPNVGLPIGLIRSVAKSSPGYAAFRGSGLHSGGIQDADRITLFAVTSLRDRGYIVPRGRAESPDTRWRLPAECVLTGTGYLRAKDLFGD